MASEDQCTTTADALDRRLAQDLIRAISDSGIFHGSIGSARRIYDAKEALRLSLYARPEPQPVIRQRTPGELRAYYDGVDAALSQAKDIGAEAVAESYRLLTDEQKGRTNKPGAEPWEEKP